MPKFSNLALHMALTIFSIFTSASFGQGGQPFEIPQLPPTLKSQALRAPFVAMQFTGANGKKVAARAKTKKVGDAFATENLTVNSLVDSYLLKGYAPVGLWVDTNDNLRYDLDVVEVLLGVLETGDQFIPFVDQAGARKQFISQAKTILNAVGIEVFSSSLSFSLNKNGQLFSGDKDKEQLEAAQLVGNVFKLKDKSVYAFGQKPPNEKSLLLLETGEFKLGNDIIGVVFERNPELSPLEQVIERSKLRRMSRQISGLNVPPPPPALALTQPPPRPLSPLAIPTSDEPEGELAETFFKNLPGYENLIAMLYAADPVFVNRLLEEMRVSRVVFRPVESFSTQQKSPLKKYGIQVLQPGLIEIARFDWEQRPGLTERDQIRKVCFALSGVAAGILNRIEPSRRKLYRVEGEYSNSLERAYDLTENIKYYFTRETKDNLLPKEIESETLAPWLLDFVRGAYTQRLESLGLTLKAQRDNFFRAFLPFKLVTPNLDADYLSWQRRIKERTRLAGIEDYKYVFGQDPKPLPLTADEEISRLEAIMAKSIEMIRARRLSAQEAKAIATDMERMIKKVSGEPVTPEP